MLCSYEEKEIATWREQIRQTRDDSLIYPCLLSLLSRAEADHQKTLDFLQSPEDQFTRELLSTRLEHGFSWVQIGIAIGVNEDTARISFERYRDRYEKKTGIKIDTRIF